MWRAALCPVGSMTEDSTDGTRTATLVVVLTVMIGVGLTVGFGGGAAVLAQDDPGDGTNQTGDEANQNGTETNQSQDGKTVTAEGVAVERVHMENVRVSGLTVDLSQLISEGPEAAVSDAVREAMGDNVEGLQVESLEFGNVSTADISVENNVATIDAELDSVTVTGLAADRVTMQQGGAPGASGDTPAADRSQSEVVGSMMAEANVDADRVVAENVSIDRIVVERADEGAPETASGNGTDNGTETPTDNVTETPTDNATEAPTDNDTVDDANRTASVRFDDQTSNGTASRLPR